jgi:hypothetical protein
MEIDPDVADTLPDQILADGRGIAAAEIQNRNIAVEFGAMILNGAQNEPQFLCVAEDVLGRKPRAARPRSIGKVVCDSK